MKSNFKFNANGFEYKAEFEGLYKSNGKDEKCFQFYKLYGNAWIYRGCLGFPIKFTKNKIISEALENLL